MFIQCLINRKFLSGDKEKRIERPCARPPNVRDFWDQFLIFPARLILYRFSERFSVACQKRCLHYGTRNTKFAQEFLFVRCVVPYYLT